MILLIWHKCPLLTLKYLSCASSYTSNPPWMPPLLYYYYWHHMLQSHAPIGAPDIIIMPLVYLISFLILWKYKVQYNYFSFIAVIIIISSTPLSFTLMLLMFYNYHVISIILLKSIIILYRYNVHHNYFSIFAVIIIILSKLLSDIDINVVWPFFYMILKALLPIVIS